MKILLIYPRLNYPSQAAICPPLGILYIAAGLRNAGHEVSFLDLTHHTEIPDLEQHLRGARVAGLSITSAMAGKAFEVVKKIRLINPEITCIAGGPHPTVMPEHTLRAGFDAIVIGEGDISALNLVRAVEEKMSIKEVEGIAFLSDDRMIMTEPGHFIQNLDSLPEPARDLVDWEGYYGRPAPFDGIIASRGCPHRCLFCKPMQDRLFGKKIRYRSPGAIVSEINSYRLIWERRSPLAGSGIPFHVMFVDDMFLSRSDWVYSFCDELEKKGADFWWGCQARVDAIREDLLRRMIDAGCRNIAFGVESGSQNVLDFLRKDIKVEMTRRAFEICHRLNIATHAYIIIGSPEESREDLEATFRLLGDIRPTTCYVARATPMPGSYLYDYSKEEGILEVEDFDESYDYYCNKTPIRLAHLSTEDLDYFEARVSELFPNMSNLGRKPGKA